MEVDIETRILQQWNLGTERNFGFHELLSLA
jgi:hypothetical protein